MEFGCCVVAYFDSWCVLGDVCQGLSGGVRVQMDEGKKEDTALTPDVVRGSDGATRELNWP